MSGIVRLFTSLQLTIICLAIGMVLIFVGTLAQVKIGIDQAVDLYFRSMIVWWSPPGAGWRIPIMPGGFLVGFVLLINLVASHLYRFKWSWRKSGIWLVHLGLIVLLLGELFTALFARESFMSIAEGGTKSYSEAHRATELVIADQTDPKTDRVLAIAESGLEAGRSYQHPRLPLRIDIVEYFANSQLFRRSAESAGFNAPAATAGIGLNITAREAPRTGRQDARDISVAWVAVFSPEGPLGTWMVSNVFGDPQFAQPEQTFEYGGRTYRIELRQERFYKPYSITLLDFAHDKYPGTEIPKNFSSRIRLVDPDRHEDREVLIYMNHPLRHRGLTFFQHSFPPDNSGTVLQVVQNPSRHLPYISCILVFTGMVVQFGIHLFGFFRKRRKMAPVTT